MSARSSHVDAAGTWHPDAAWREQANWTAFLAREGLADYPALVAKASADPDWFWTALIRFLDIRFETPFRQVGDLSRGIEHARWCVGGRMNMTVSLLDRHLEAGRGDHTALVWESEGGATRQLSYAELAAETSRLTAGLQSLGIREGDVVALYLPMIPEAVAAYLAVIRIGAITLPLFSGFGTSALVSRLRDGEAVAVITAESFARRGKRIAMKAILDEALAELPAVRSVVVVPAPEGREPASPMQPGRDVWWDDLTAGRPADVTPRIVDADAPMMVVYTSGTTGKSKGTVHTHCGFVTKTGEDYLLAFDLKPSDRWMWMSDLGWLIGPIQIVATLLAGATLVLAEGGPDYPQRGRLWRLVETRRLTILGLGPTIARLMQGHGAEEAARHDLSSLRAIASTGEPWDEASWRWLLEHVLRGQGPLMNNIGGSEMGGILATNVLYPIPPTSFHGPIPGTGADIVDDEGRSVASGEVGELVLREACIGTSRGLWRDPDRYIESYWRRFPGLWHHGDWASREADGAWYVHGRSDDTIKLAGKRTGPAEIEALLLATGRVGDAAAVAVPDPIKGSAVVCAVVPRPGESEDGLTEELSRAVVAGLGPAFRPKTVLVVADLPRTRNLKVMRRVIRAALVGDPPGDLSALVNPQSVEALRALAVTSNARD